MYSRSPLCRCVRSQVFFRELPVSLLSGIPVEMVLATSTLEVRGQPRGDRPCSAPHGLRVLPCACACVLQQCEHLLRVVSGKNRDLLVRGTCDVCLVAVPGHCAVAVSSVTCSYGCWTSSATLQCTRSRIACRPKTLVCACVAVVECTSWDCSSHTSRPWRSCWIWRVACCCMYRLLVYTWFGDHRG